MFAYFGRPFFIRCILLLALVSLSNPSNSVGQQAFQDSVILNNTKTFPPHWLEQKYLKAGLVNVQLIVPKVEVDLKYAGSKNFLGINFYDHFNRAYLQIDAIVKIKNAERLLELQFPYYHLVIFDAARPVSIQQQMWDSLKTPNKEKRKYLASPLEKSLHNYGAAVDVGIADQNGFLLDMGTCYDFFGELAHPNLEKKLFLSGDLSYRQISNRQLLRKVMTDADFMPIDTEWWHVNSCSRKAAQEKYPLIE